MRNSILIEVSDININDFGDKIPVPEFIESTEGGVQFLFQSIEEVKLYQDSLLLKEDQENDLLQKVNTELVKALDENQVVLDSIKAYAKAVFQFIFKREGHRNDKLVILEDLLAGIKETTNSWEMDNAIKEATYELGTMVLNHNLTFTSYAHNDVDYNFELIRNRLIKELAILKISVVTA